MTQTYDPKSVQITVNGSVLEGIESIEWDAPLERVQGTIGRFTACLGSFTTVMTNVSRAFRKLLRAWSPARVRRQKRRSRAWYRREAQRVFQRACRQGVRLNVSAADVVRVLRGKRS